MRAYLTAEFRGYGQTIHLVAQNVPGGILTRCGLVVVDYREVSDMIPLTCLRCIQHHRAGERPGGRDRAISDGPVPVTLQKPGHPEGERQRASLNQSCPCPCPY